MASCYKDNLELLNRRFPEIYQQIVSKGEEEGIPLLETPSGGVTVKGTTPGGREIFIHSSRDPLSEGERIGRALPSGHPLLVFLGCGLFYHILAALRDLSGHLPVLLVEHDPEVLHAALRAVPLAPVLEREGTILLLETSPRDVESFVVERYTPEDLAKLLTVRHLPCFEIAPDYYEGLEKRLTLRRDLANCMAEDPELAKFLQSFPHPEELTMHQILAEAERASGRITESKGVLLMMEALGGE